jgi:hypothetical protein
MNYQGFIDAFNTRFYAATTADGLGWEEDEICEFLNSAQMKLVENFVGVGKVEDISELINSKTGYTVTSVSGKEYSVDFTSATGFMYFIEGKIALTSGSRNLDRISIAHLNSFRITEDNATVFRNPKIAIGQSGKIGVILIDSVSGITSTATALSFRYVIEPTKFSDAGTCTNLNVGVHDKIVDLAVQIAVSTMIKTGQSTQ